MRFLYRIALVLLLSWGVGYGLAFAFDVKTTDGPGGWARDGNGIRVQNPDQDQVIIDTLSISEDSNWQTVVGQVTEVYGVHTHAFGPNACLIETRTTTTVKMNSCTIHVGGGLEYDFDTALFPSFTSITPAFDSTFFGINASGLVAQDTLFTDSDLKTTIQLARTQETQTGLTVIDLRNIVSEVDRKNFIYKREGIGPIVTLSGGYIASETGTRNLNLTEGSFLDEENELHATSIFNSVSGLILYRTTAAFDSWTAVSGGRTLLQVDNINYNDVVSGGLLPAQNNNKFILSTLWMSEAGGGVNGVDTGRDPTFFLFYGTDEYDSLEDARTAPFNIGSFGNSKPTLMPLSKLVLRKNQAAIEDFFDIRPFITRIAGTPSAIQTTASLQTTYDNSPNGGLAEIKTNDQNEDLTIQYEGTNGKIQEWQDVNTNPVFTVWTSFLKLSKGTILSPFDYNTQFSNYSGGPPPAADCDSDTERDRQFIDTAAHRLYVCNGAARGWDYIALTD